MSEEQLSTLLVQLKQNAGLHEKPKGAADIDAVVAIARQNGSDATKANWLTHQAKQSLEISDAEPENVTGGNCDLGSLLSSDVPNACGWCD